MYAFRDGKSRVPLRVLKGRFHHVISSLPANAAGDGLIEALLRAGELEAGVADEPSATSLEKAGAVTDLLARQFVSRDGSIPKSQILNLLEQFTSPASVNISAPEGFAYYGLHPRSYANTAIHLLHNFAGRQFAVVGIRSIGTTLSAVVCAALLERGVHAERITVRPSGHPFDRHTAFSREQQQWIHQMREQSTAFFVVDEGPGLSGSSFLSVAEALVAVGVAREQIILLCSHAPDPKKLCAANAVQRCGQFTWQPMESSAPRPADATVFIGGGEWRRRFSNDQPGNWPASWLEMERPKFFSSDRGFMYKFEGLGHYGRRVLERSQVLHHQGFGPAVDDAGDHSGYLRYRLQRGSPDSARNISQHSLSRLAEYCALRLRHFPAEFVPAEGQVSLAAMAQVNAREEFGIDLAISENDFKSQRPIFADSRMMPWEWIISADGQLFKTDGASHGDDHFFPGPCDIAWDLAGAIIEWQLSSAAKNFFIETYRRLSGDDPTYRLPAYILAYSLFRLGYFDTACNAMAGTEEEPRLRAARAFYAPSHSNSSRCRPRPSESTSYISG